MVRLERPAKPVAGWLEVYGGIGVVLLFIARFVPLARLPLWAVLRGLAARLDDLASPSAVRSEDSELC